MSSIGVRGKLRTKFEKNRTILRIYMHLKYRYFTNINQVYLSMHL